MVIRFNDFVALSELSPQPIYNYFFQQFHDQKRI